MFSSALHPARSPRRCRFDEGRRDVRRSSRPCRPASPKASALLPSCRAATTSSCPRGVALFLWCRACARPGARLPAAPLLGMFFELLGEFPVRPLRRRLGQMVLPVEDDEIADQPVDMPDPVAHLGAFVRCPAASGGSRARSRRDTRQIVPPCSGWPSWINVGITPRRVDLQIFRRVMLHGGHVDHVALIGEALLGEAQPDCGAEALERQPW